MTQKGYDQLFELGKSIHRLYLDSSSSMEWLNDRIPNNAVLRSTDVLRTQQSGQALFNGLFPNQINSTILHIRPRSVDNLLMDPHAHSELEKIIHENESKSPFVDYLDLCKELEDQMNSILKSNLSMHRYFDILNCRVCSKQSLPCGPKGCITQELLQRVQQVGTWAPLYYYNASRELEMKHRVGSLVSELARVFESDSNSIHLYSGHDTTLSPLMGFFTDRNLPWPPYASFIILEKWQRKNKNHFRLIYNGEIMEIKNKVLDLF